VVKFRTFLLTAPLLQIIIILNKKHGVKNMKNHILTLIVAFVLLFFAGACNNAAGGDPYDPNRTPTTVTLQYGDLSIHFLELGNRYVGDSVYIKFKDIDILIDAGSKQSSATTIITYIDQFISDDRLDFIIATHAHEDHIAGFYTHAFGSSYQVTGIFDNYEIGTIIDFPRTGSSTATYTNYKAARDRAVANGAVHFTALQCYRELDGAKRKFNLGAEGVYLEILYHYYYENTAGNENNYSVVVRIIKGEHKFLFTGDLEKEAEDKLVEYYAEHYGGLGQHVLFKAGHHGSYTSSYDNLLNEIKPQFVCVCACVGTTQYTANAPTQFPSQAFINRVAPHTDAVYITTRAVDYANDIFESFNGNIVFLVRDGKFSVTGSNNSLKLKETEWFKANRTMPPAWEQ